MNIELLADKLKKYPEIASSVSKIVDIAEDTNNININNYKVSQQLSSLDDLLRSLQHQKSDNIPEEKCSQTSHPPRTILGCVLKETRSKENARISERNGINNSFAFSKVDDKATASFSRLNTSDSRVAYLATENSSSALSDSLRPEGHYLRQ